MCDPQEFVRIACARNQSNVLSDLGKISTLFLSFSLPLLYTFIDEISCCTHLNEHST